MSVSFNTIPSGIRVPLFYAEMDNSAAATPTTQTASLLIGQMLDDGKAVAGKPLYVSTAAMAKELFGRGSMLARMVEAYRTVDSFGQLVVIPVTDGSSTAATGKITCSGTAAESGTISLYIGSDRVQVSIADGTTAEEAAKDIADAVALAKDLPVTASASAGIVTLTARQKGTYGNDIQLAVNLRGAINGEKDVLGLGVEVEAMAKGATDPDLTAAFAAMGDEQYDFIGCPYSDAATLDALAEKMNDTSGRWSPFQMIFGHVYTAKRGDVNTLVTFGKTRNNQHETVVGVEPSLPTHTAEVLAAYLARTSVFISADLA